jgi:hypothetical protein
MKMITFLFILLAFFASVVDGVICADHETYEVAKEASFTLINKTVNKINQTVEFPLDHCATGVHSCTRNLSFVASYNKRIAQISTVLTTKFHLSIP